MATHAECRRVGFRTFVRGRIVGVSSQWTVTRLAAQPRMPGLPLHLRDVVVAGFARLPSREGDRAGLDVIESPGPIMSVLPESSRDHGAAYGEERHNQNQRQHRQTDQMLGFFEDSLH